MTRRLTCAASVAILAAVVAAAPAAAGPAVEKATPVIVTNSADNPVPVVINRLLEVIGTIKLDPTANTVKLDPEANRVTVDNPVKLEQLQRYQVRKTLFITSTSEEEYGFHELFTVPDGKRFVSDFVSVKGDCFFLDPEKARSLSALNADERRMDIPLDVTRRYDAGVMFQQSFPIVLWADEGATVRWDLRSNADTCAWDMNLAGHFEPMS